MRSSALLALCASLAAPAAWAGKLAMVINGDCRDPELISSGRELARELALAREVQVLDEQKVLEKLGRGATTGMEALHRQVDGLQQQYWQGHYPKVVIDADPILQEVSRLPPGMARWQMYSSGLVILGLSLTRLHRDQGAREAFLRVLRVDPAYQLDPDYFSPSTRQMLDRIRKGLAAQRKHQVRVTSTPSDATVFLDGKAIRKTPFSGALAPGTYQVIVGTDDALSLPRMVNISQETEVHVDLRFESGIDTERSPCLSGSTDESERLLNAVRLGTILDVDQLVVLRFERRKSGPSWLAATLVGVQGGEKIREGGLNVGAGGVAPLGVSELARFVVTGEATPNVRTAPSAHPTTAARVAEPPPAEAHAGQGTTVAATTTAPAAATAAPGVETAAEGRSGWRRPVGIGLAGAGVAAALVGGLFQVSAVESQTEFDDWVRRGQHAEGAVAARAALDRHQRDQTLAIAGYGVGAAALGAGLFLWLGERDDSPTSVSVAPLAQGASIAFSGKF